MPEGSASSADASVTSTATASARPPASVIAATVGAALSSRAAATTVAPWRARFRAIARPIPREAPVTSAILPVSSSMSGAQRLDGRQIVGHAEVRDHGVAMDLPDQTAQHRAGANLNIRGDALGRKATHDLLPTHRRRDLGDQRLD